METLEEKVMRALVEGAKSFETLLSELEATNAELTDALETLESTKHVQNIDGQYSLLPIT